MKDKQLKMTKTDILFLIPVFIILGIGIYEGIQNINPLEYQLMNYCQQNNLLCNPDLAYIFTSKTISILFVTTSVITLYALAISKLREIWDSAEMDVNV